MSRRMARGPISLWKNQQKPRRDDLVLDCRVRTLRSGDYEVNVAAVLYARQFILFNDFMLNILLHTAARAIATFVNRPMKPRYKVKSWRWCLRRIECTLVSTLSLPANGSFSCSDLHSLCFHGFIVVFTFCVDVIYKVVRSKAVSMSHVMTVVCLSARSASTNLNYVVRNNLLAIEADRPLIFCIEPSPKLFWFDVKVMI